MSNENLIPQFVGLIICDCGCGGVVDSDGTFRGYAQDYSSDWALLMPVVEKIEELGIVAITNVNCTIRTADLELIANVKSTSKINAVYNAVMEFILWYNQNKVKCGQ